MNSNKIKKQSLTQNKKNKKKFSSQFTFFSYSSIQIKKKHSMFQLAIKEDKKNEDDTINKTIMDNSSSNNSSSFVSNWCSTQKQLFNASTIPFNSLNYATCSRNHSEFILNGLKSLKSSRILCDITLIAESKFAFFLSFFKNE